MDVYLDIAQFFDSEGEALFVDHHRAVVKSVEVWKRLVVGFVFDELLSSSVEEADMRVASHDVFAVKLEDQSQHSVSSWMLRTRERG